MLATLLVHASVTDQLVDFATNVVGDLGLAGIFLLMLLESACIPTPQRGDHAVRGLQRLDGDYPLWAPVLVATAANLVGSWIAYAVGYYGRVELIERHGGKLHIRKHHLDVADRWFERHGEATVFFSRMLPVVRTFISLPAGVAQMPFWRFTALHRARLPAVGARADVIGSEARRQLGRPGRTSCTTSTTRSSPRSSSGSSTSSCAAPARAAPAQAAPAPDASSS